MKDQLMEMGICTKIIDHYSNPSLLLDEGLKIIWANKAAEKIFGKDIAGKGHDTVCGIKDNENISINTFQKGKEYRYRISRKFKDEEEHTYLCTTNALPGKEGNPKVAIEVFEDIAEKEDVISALKESEDKYHSLIDNLPVGVYRRTLEHNARFIAVNPALVRMFGYGSEDELKSVPIQDMYADRKRWTEFIALIKEKTKLTDFEIEFRKKDRSTFWASITASLSHDKRIKDYLIDGIVEDITDRKEAKNALMLSEEKYRRLAEEQTDVVLRVTPEGILEYCSPAVRNFGGYDAAAEIGNPIRKYFCNEKDYEHATEMILRSTKTKEGFTVEFLYSPKDRKPFYVEVNAKPVFKNDKVLTIQCVMRNITRRKDAEKALIASNMEIEALNRFNKSIIDGISDEVIAVDSKNHEILLANRQLLKNKGLGEDGLKGLKFEDIYPATEGYSCPMTRTLKTKQKEESEIRITDEKTNLARYFSRSAYPIMDKKGKVSQVIHISREITARRVNEEKLAAINEKIISLFHTSNKLLETRDLDNNIEVAVQAFETLGFDRVRIYSMKDGRLVGMKSNHIDDATFRKLVLPLKDKHKDACSKGMPIIDKSGKKIVYSPKVLGKDGLMESASLPMFSKGRCLGMISLDNKHSNRPIHQDELNILMSFTNQIASAIENATLHDNQEKQLNELRALYDIASTITTSLDLEKLLSMIVIKIVKLLKVDICSIMLLDETGRYLIPCATFDIRDYDNRYEESVELDSSISGQAFRQNEIIYVRSIKDERQFHNKRYAKERGLVSMVSVPMCIEGVPMGVINIYTRKEKEFSENENELLMGLANHAAMIIKEANLYERIKRDKKNLTALVQIGNAMNATLDFDDLLDIVLRRTVEFTSSDMGYITMKKGNILTLRQREKGVSKRIDRIRFSSDSGIISSVIRQKKPEIIRDLAAEGLSKADPSSRSAAILPLLYKDRCIGLLHLESCKLDNYRFFKKSLDILTNHISTAIENSMMYDEIRNFNTRLRSEIRIATKELMEKNIELQKLDRLKSDFVSNVSHELRTPLTSISGYTKLMLMEKLGKLNEKQYKSLEIVSEESDRLTRLINDVLDLSKMESGKVELKTEKLDMARLAQESIETLEMNAKEKGIAISLAVRSKDTLFEGGPDLMKQVFINLINNALKFTDKGGRIKVSVARQKDYIKVSVADNGKGIPKEHIPKLFNKFVQVDSSMTREHRGTGLGLVIVKHTLKLHGGLITVKSKVGKGSTFTFYVPISQKGLQGPQQA